MDINSLQLKIFYPDNVPVQDLSDYNLTFDLWYRIWVETREEVDKALATPSDNFSRQSEILALFLDGKPIGMICHRYVDIRQDVILRDSFFSRGLWPEAVMQTLPSLGESFVLGSHVFIDRNFRKSTSGLPTKNILCALSFAHINGSKPDVVLGMMRKDKGMHDVFYRSGAITLLKDTNWYQIPVDLVAFFPKKKAIEIDVEYKETVERLASTSQDFGANYYERNNLRRKDGSEDSRPLKKAS